MKSDRDKCFDDAIQQHNKQDPDHALKAQYNVCWIRDFRRRGSKWVAVGNKAFRHAKHLINFAAKNHRFIYPVWRVPDLTITTPNNTQIVIDNKFENDKFDNRVSTRSGYTQRWDYKQINKERGFTMKDPQLTPEACGCNA